MTRPGVDHTSMDTTLPTLAHIAEYLNGRHFAMEPGAFRAAFDTIAPRLHLPVTGAAGAVDFTAMKREAAIRRTATIVEGDTIVVGDGVGAYAMTDGGVAVISITGTLVNRFSWLAALCGLASYDAIGATIEAAIDDPRTKAILLDVDSPGGEVSGMLDLADRVRAAGQFVPVWAAVNTLAASAAYCLSSAAQRVTVPRSGMAGSIGVVAVHIDRSAADEAAGLKFTALYSGARKIDGWGHAAIAPAAAERLQQMLDHERRQFAGAVSAFRGLPLAHVMDTEAGCYLDREAVTQRLADAVQSFDQTLIELTEHVGGSSGSGATRPTQAPDPWSAAMASAAAESSAFIRTRF